MKRWLPLLAALALSCSSALADDLSGFFSNGGGINLNVGQTPAASTNPIPVQQSVAGAAASASNALPVQPSVGGATVSASNPIPVQTVAPQSVSQANITSLCAAVPNSSTAVTLTAAATTIDIYTSTDADILHVNWTNGTATTGNAAIYPGGTYRYQGAAISAFKVIGEGTSGHYNVVAK